MQGAYARGLCRWAAAGAWCVIPRVLGPNLGVAAVPGGGANSGERQRKGTPLQHVTPRARVGSLNCFV